MKNLIKKITFTILFMILMVSSSFAAKYTLCSGKEFNARIKYAYDVKSIYEFKRNFSIPDNVTLVDISEDSDSSVVAYMEDGILYFVCEDEVYFNNDISYMFNGFLAIKDINVQEFDFSKCRKTNFMFANCINLTNLDLDNDTDIKLNEMEGMFYNCQSLVDLYIPMLVTKSVSSFKNLFYGCRNIKNIQVDREKFITKNAKDFTGMFTNCYMLKTNFGKKATSINESSYKAYAKCGDDDTEGLIKDFDFEYDDYGANDGNYKIDSINDVSLTENFSSDEIKSAKSHFNAQLSTDSSLNQLSGKDSNLLSDIDVDAILMAESTYIPNLEEKIKEFNDRRNKSLDYGLEDEEIMATASTFTPGRLNRPTPEDYANLGLEENYSSYTFIDNSIYIVVIVILVTIIVGLLMYKRKSKKENEEIDKSYDDF